MLLYYFEKFDIIDPNKRALNMNENINLFQDSVVDVFKKNPKIFDGYYLKPAISMAPLTTNFNRLISKVIDPYTLDSYRMETFQNRNHNFEHAFSVDTYFMQKVYPTIIDYQHLKSFINTLTKIDHNLKDLFVLEFSQNELVRIKLEVLVMNESWSEAFYYKIYDKEYDSHPNVSDIQSLYELDFIFNFEQYKLVLTGSEYFTTTTLSDLIHFSNVYCENKEKYIELFQMSKI